MIAADRRAPSARLLILDADGRITHAPRRAFVDWLRPGDLVVANDAATLPASLTGVHEPTGDGIEVRLAARKTLAPDDVSVFSAVVFGNGDFHTRTEDRPLPPRLMPGDRLWLGPLTATIAHLLDHPRLVSLHFEGTADRIWAGLAQHGRPIQYAHVPAPLALWDVWSPIAGAPVAFEPPSAGFVLDWNTLAAMRARAIGFATLTHAAGISSTGDPALDRRLPLDEAYWIPVHTAQAIARTRAHHGRIIAVGTTVVRALEHSAAVDAHVRQGFGRQGHVRAGAGLATGRIDDTTERRIVDAIISGTHEPGTSHYDLLRAFVDEDTLARVSDALESSRYRTHEFGDFILIEGQAPLKGLPNALARTYNERHAVSSLERCPTPLSCSPS